MRILYSYDCLTTVGGADRILAEKASWLAEHGFEVAMVLSQQCGRPMTFAPSDKVEIVDLNVDFDEQYKYRANILRRFWVYMRCMRQYKRRFRAFVRKWRPDIIDNTLGRETIFLSRLDDGSVKMGETHLAKAFIRNFHLMEQKGGVQRLVARWYRRRMERAVGRYARLVCLTKADADAWSDIAKTTVIPNFYPFMPERQSDCKAKSAIAVGRFSEQKGYDYMVKAWQIVARRHPDWTLNIYGGGDIERDQIATLIHKAGLDGKMIMHEPTPDIQSRYTESSMLVLSSRFEGFPMVLLEAMACGVPCVAFDCPNGPSDTINHGEDGYVVPYLDTNALAEKICALIENPTLREQMGAAARRNIRRYDKETIMLQWKTLFEELADKKKQNK